MTVSLKNFTLRYLIIILLVIVALWATLFYALMLKKIHNNVDDGLKNQKINIIRQVYLDSTLLQVNNFGVNQFRILPTKAFTKGNRFSNDNIYIAYDDQISPYRLLKTDFYAPNGQAYSLEIRTSTLLDEDFQWSLTIGLVILYVLVILSIYLVNNFVLNRALNPLSSIISDLKSYRFGGKSSLRYFKTRVTELYILQDKLKEMFTRNEDLFAQQKIFIENASHELQTPLAVALTRLDLILENPLISEKLMVEIEQSRASIQRMVNLNKSLLTLSKIENRQFSEDTLIDFNKVSKEVLEDFHEIFLFKEISLNIKVNGSFIFLANQFLVNTLLSNLIKNAIRYNKPRGKIDIEFNENSFSISNSSEYPALEVDLIFNRFYKNSTDNNSTGLGLSIVKSIIDTYPALTISYQYQESCHIFTLNKK